MKSINEIKMFEKNTNFNKVCFFITFLKKIITMKKKTRYKIKFIVENNTNVHKLEIFKIKLKSKRQI